MEDINGMDTSIHVGSIQSHWFSTTRWGSPQEYEVGFYEYGISPFQQKLFKGALNPGLFKFAGRATRWAMFLGPPFLFYYSLKGWADAKVGCL